MFIYDKDKKPFTWGILGTAPSISIIGALKMLNIIH